jgi:serine/threonine protein kinase
MERGGGGDLLARIDERISESNAQRYMRDMATGFVYMHKQKIVHRDIKPENIFKR